MRFERWRRGGARNAPRRGRRIEPSFVKRMALTHAPDRKQAAPDDPVALEACDGVDRARRLETADASEKGREDHSIHA
jgi:hypothetical protein